MNCVERLGNNNEVVSTKDKVAFLRASTMAGGRALKQMQSVTRNDLFVTSVTVIRYPLEAVPLIESSL